MTNTTLDFTALDAAWNAKIADGLNFSAGHIVRRGGSVLTERKRQSLFDALHEMAQEHRAGTLPGFSSHQDAGGYYWRKVWAWSGTAASDDRWRRNYSTDTTACEEMGRWLEANRALIENVPVATAAGPALVVGEQQTVAVLDGNLILVTHFHDDQSCNYTNTEGVARSIRRVSETDLRVITEEDILETTIDQPNGRTAMRGERLRLRNVYPRPGSGVPRIRVMNADTRVNHGWVELRHIRVAVPAAAQAAAYVRPALAVDDDVVYDGRICRVIRRHADGTVTLRTWDDEGSRSETVVRDAQVTFVLVPGETRLRRLDKPDHGYNNRQVVPGQEYVFVRRYSSTDRAIWLLHPESRADLRYTCCSLFEVVMPESVIPTRPLPGRREEAWHLPTGTLLYVEDNTRNEDPNRAVVWAHNRITGTWNLESYPRDEILAAEPGDQCSLLVDTGGMTQGTMLTYDGATGYSGSADVWALYNGERVLVQRHHIKFGTPMPPKPPIVALTTVVDGIEYVRKDVVDKDMTALVETLHRGSVENSLCSVYDRVTADADRRTEYLKMGPRYAEYDVVVEQTITVRRTIRVAQQTTEEAARERALYLARDYTLREVAGRRTGETVAVTGHGEPTVHAASRATT